MSAKIEFQILWVDEGSVSLDVSVADGRSAFSTNVVVPSDLLLSHVRRLNAFSKEIYGGIYDFTLGNFGEEFAYGGFTARLHFAEPGVLSIACFVETGFFKFGNRRVADSARIYLRAEVNSLDTFILEFENLIAKKTHIATLNCN